MCAWGIRVIEGRQFSLHAYLYSVTHSAKRQNITSRGPKRRLECAVTLNTCNQMKEQNRKGWTGGFWEHPDVGRIHTYRVCSKALSHLQSVVFSLGDNEDKTKLLLPSPPHPSPPFPSLSLSLSFLLSLFPLLFHHWGLNTGTCTHQANTLTPELFVMTSFLPFILDSPFKLPMLLLSILRGPR